MTDSTEIKDPSTLREFEIDVCRAGYGFATIAVMAENEYEAGQLALDQAGNHSYNEKSSEYSLSSEVPNPAARKTHIDVYLEVSCENDFIDRPMAGVLIAITPTEIEEMKQLFGLMKAHELSEVRRFRYADYMYSEDTNEDSRASLDAPELVLTSDAISFQGFAQQSDIIVRSNSLNFKTLVAAFDAGAETIVVNSGNSTFCDLEFLEDIGLKAAELDIGTRTVVITPTGPMTTEEAQAILAERAEEDAEDEAEELPRDNA